MEWNFFHPSQNQMGRNSPMSHSIVGGLLAHPYPATLFAALRRSPCCRRIAFAPCDWDGTLYSIPAAAAAA